jgi:hypothetical protein
MNYPAASYEVSKRMTKIEASFGEFTRSDYRQSHPPGIWKVSLNWPDLYCSHIRAYLCLTRTNSKVISIDASRHVSPFYYLTHHPLQDPEPVRTEYKATPRFERIRGQFIHRALMFSCGYIRHKCKKGGAQN